MCVYLYMYNTYTQNTHIYVLQIGQALSSVNHIDLSHLLITCTCTSSRVSSSPAYKHTPQPQYSSDPVNMTLLLVSPNWVFCLLLTWYYSPANSPSSCVLRRQLSSRCGVCSWQSCSPGSISLRSCGIQNSDYPLTNPRKPSEVVLLTSCLQSQLQYPQTVK